MSKRAKVIIILLIFSVCLVLYLVLQSKIITIKPQNNESQATRITPKIDEVQMEYEYKNAMKSVIADYEAILDEINLVAASTTTAAPLDKQAVQDRLTELKSRIADLKAPQTISNDAKKLSLEYLLPAINLSVSYLVTEDKKDDSSARAITLKIKEDFPWTVK